MALGRRLASAATGGLVVYLSGDLGSGKTTLARGILQGSGVRDEVTSPSYTLVETYEAQGRVFCHMDCFRCKRPTEWLDSGLAEPLGNADLSLVEWPEKATGLPPPDVEVTISMTGIRSARDVLVLGRTALGRKLVAGI